MGTGIGSFVAVLLAVAVCVFGYMMLAHKGPFKDDDDSDSGTGAGGGPGRGGDRQQRK